MMKRVFRVFKGKSLFTLLLIVLFGISCGKTYSGKKAPEIKNASMDLSSWNFDSDGPISLSGEWKFAWKKLLFSKDLSSDPKANFESLDSIKVPGVWNGYKVGPDKEAGGKGYGTYILKLKSLDTRGQKLAFSARHLATAYKIYLSSLDGKKVIDLNSNGTVSDNEAEAIPQQLATIADFHETLVGDFYLIIQVSNFHHRDGGFWNVLSFGKEETLKTLFNQETYRDFFVTGIIFVMAIYHFLLWSQRREDLAALYFGILCLSIDGILFSMGKYIFYFWPQASVFLYEFSFKVEDWGNYVAVGSCYSFLKFFPVILVAKWRRSFGEFMAYFVFRF